MNRNVLVISTHPDDETLGCGGTLLRHRAAGDPLYWLVATQGYQPKWSAEIIERKAKEVERAAAAYGMEKLFKLGFPSTRLDTIPRNDLMDRILDVIEPVRPGIVYVVHGGDAHSDHQAIFAATMSVAKPFHMGRLGICRLLCYETMCSTEAAPPQPDRIFLPNCFTDITPYLEKKIEIMSLYETEVQPDPLPRGPSAIRALARFRGATASIEYAEAFMLIRELI